MMGRFAKTCAASSIADILASQPAIPIIDAREIDEVLSIAHTLVAAGLPVMQVSLRSAAALQSLSSLRQVKGAIVGVSSAINAFDIEDAVAAGAKFVVASGLSGSLTGSASFANIPFLPSFATPSELLLGFEMGFSCFEFYPAETFGGARTLEELSERFGSARFYPLGGITETNASSYLKLPAVLSVGATWITPRHLVAEKRWDEIGLLASSASKLR